METRWVLQVELRLLQGPPLRAGLPLPREAVRRRRVVERVRNKETTPASSP